MEVLLLNVLLALSVPQSSGPKVLVGTEVQVVSGDWEGCKGTVRYRSGNEYGVYMTCGEYIRHYDFVHGKHLKVL